MTDASDVAAGAVLMQWQKRQIHNYEDPQRRLRRQHQTPSLRRIRHAWQPDTNYRFWDIFLRPSTLRNDDGPSLIRRPALLS
eukprot:802161-Pleurochrysis_carterae.AAC.1